MQVCECLGLEWDQTIPQQFDNVAVALLTFFEISTTEAWTAVTYAAVDATEEDMQPIRDKHLVRVWFFILFMLFGAYLVMNLFVGVVVDNFKKVAFLLARSLACPPLLGGVGTTHVYEFRSESKHSEATRNIAKRNMAKRNTAKRNESK